MYISILCRIDIITAIFPVTWQCLRCCVETRDLRYVIIFRSKKVNTDGVVSLNVLTARRLQDNKLKLKTVQSTGKCWQWLSHREYCIIYTRNDPIFRLVSFLFAVFVLFWSRHVDHLCIALKWRLNICCLIPSGIVVHMDRLMVSTKFLYCLNFNVFIRLMKSGKERNPLCSKLGHVTVDAYKQRTTATS